MILVPISIGELVDKITILKIKQMYIQDTDKLQNIEKEYNELKKLFDELNLKEDEDFFELKTVNEKIWHIEDTLRLKEERNEFDVEFILSARGAYLCNNDRSNIKKKINIKHNSYIIEEKSYK